MNERHTSVIKEVVKESREGDVDYAMEPLQPSLALGVTILIRG